MNESILDEGGTVMQFVGDAVMAVFGAPFPQADHAERALAAAHAMHAAQVAVNERWESEGLPAFGLGIGLSTGEVAAALLGSEERLEYTLVGDTVNLSQRLQQLRERRRDRAVERDDGHARRGLRCGGAGPAGRARSRNAGGGIRRSEGAG